MNKKLVTLFSSAIILTLPVVILADINPGPAPDTQNLSVTQFINIVLNFIWPVFVGFAVIIFLIAGFLFLTAQGDPAKISTARNAVLLGVIVVILGILSFSIPFIIRTTLGF